jgi:hypothetical protein
MCWPCVAHWSSVEKWVYRLCRVSASWPNRSLHWNTLSESIMSRFEIDLWARNIFHIRITSCRKAQNLEGSVRLRNKLVMGIKQVNSHSSDIKCWLLNVYNFKKCLVLSVIYTLLDLLQGSSFKTWSNQFVCVNDNIWNCNTFTEARLEAEFQRLSFWLQIQRSVFDSRRYQIFWEVWVWNGVHSTSWIQLRSYLEEKVAAPI